MSLSIVAYADPIINGINNIVTPSKRPNDFVNIKEVIPEVQVDMRYYSNHNFVGRRIKGYAAPVCLLTKATLKALKQVEKALISAGLTLKVYDCYRPQSAVNDFAKWATEIDQTQMQKEFYINVDKRNLFKDNYIAYHSGHSRGSTVDLTIVPLDSSIPDFNDKVPLADCNNSQANRFPDNSLDFGTGFDCFSLKSHPNYVNFSSQIKANRLLLNTLMQQAGFKGVDTEWWHFTLIKEPYPNTYFDFPVK
jgi:D-alanyl-D-alanine dipeptidase